MFIEVWTCLLEGGWGILILGLCLTNALCFRSLKREIWPRLTWYSFELRTLSEKLVAFFVFLFFFFWVGFRGRVCATSRLVSSSWRSEFWVKKFTLL